jgi:hypothetical protein
MASMKAGDRRRRWLIAWSCLFPLLVCSAGWSGARNIGAIVLVDSTAPAHRDFAEFLQLYLDHFDIPYTIRDVAKSSPVRLDDAALIILGHSGVQADLRAALARGAGVVSFAAAFPKTSPQVQTESQSITIVSNRHYITARKEAGQRIPFRGTFPMVDYGPLGSSFEVLARAGDHPLLAAGHIGQGRVVLFSSYQWLDPETLGFFAGLDDLVWRSLVWAARKPFVMQGMPPLVSMRVDDCAGGRNRDWDYVEAIGSVGIVPHCTFMLDEITDSCARRMAQLVKAGRMQVSVHARRSAMEPNAFFWWDHMRNRPYDDAAMQNNCADASRFFARYGITPAKSINIHYEEMGRNAIPCFEKLGVEFVASWTDFGMPVYRQDMFQAAPYMKFRPAGHWAVKPTSASAGHLVYNPRGVMDWLGAGHRFFDSYVDPIDIKYDWLRKCELPPYQGTFADAGMIADGTAMLKRELDSMFPAYYFTHEVNIDRYDTKQLAQLVRGVWDRLAPYRPEPVSYDDLNRYARAQFTSHMEQAMYDTVTGVVTVRLSGNADIQTRFWVYTGEDEQVRERMERAPAFRGSVEVKFGP